MSQFIFKNYSFDTQKYELRFAYEYTHEDQKFEFTERLQLPKRQFAAYNPDLLENIIQAVHIVLGLSYWKLWCAQTIQIESFALSNSQAKYWETVYTNGLGEFFFQNSIDFRNLIAFPYAEETKTRQYLRIQTGKYLVGVGGGKDSAVTVELLKKNNMSIEGFVVETGKSYSVIDGMIEIAKIPSLRIRRTIDPQLVELNKREDTYNGHIPISAVYAWVSTLCSVLYGFDGYIASNERSANTGNTEYLGSEINHQWSKSQEFEKMTQDYLDSISGPSLEYVSLLRPFSEYSIVEKFAHYPQYFNTFTSCNRNFSQSIQTDKKWCGECPKCAFVFTLLASQLPEKTVLEVFGENLFDKEILMQTFNKLLGIEGMKPFECVGTPEEMKYALLVIHEKDGFRGSRLMKMFTQDVMPSLDTEALKHDVLFEDLSVLPEKFRQLI